jgi:hypothetical protein
MRGGAEAAAPHKRALDYARGVKLFGMIADSLAGDRHG